MKIGDEVEKDALRAFDTDTIRAFALRMYTNKEYR